MLAGEWGVEAKVYIPREAEAGLMCNSPNSYYRKTLFVKLLKGTDESPGRYI